MLCPAGEATDLLKVRSTELTIQICIGESRKRLQFGVSLLFTVIKRSRSALQYGARVEVSRRPTDRQAYCHSYLRACAVSYFLAC